MAGNKNGAMYRVVAPHQHDRVTYAELFFDRVFRLAITRISQTRLANFARWAFCMSCCFFAELSV